jgi:hypothetical protein
MAVWWTKTSSWEYHQGTMNPEAFMSVEPLDGTLLGHPPGRRSFGERQCSRWKQFFDEEAVGKPLMWRTPFAMNKG